MEQSKQFDSQITQLDSQVTQLNENDIPPDKACFKKPLRLLKRKMRESKMMTELSKNMPVDSLRLGEEEDGIRLESNSRRLRVQTEESHESKVIDTRLSRAERDRYINEQLFFKRKQE